MPSVPIPSKGDIVTIENKQYRVLKVSGTVVEVLAMYDASTSQVFNTTSKTVTFGGRNTGQKYQGSNLDTYLNETFFATLSATMQAAIVPKAINQDMWYYGSSKPSSGTYYHMTYGSSNVYYFDNKNGTAYGTAVVGSRNVYALSIKDVIDFLGVSAGGNFADTDIWQMFWNRSTNIEEYIWLRSAYQADSNYAFFVRGNNGRLSGNIYSNGTRVRPAFQIDWDILYPSPTTTSTTFVFDTTMIQRIDVYDEGGELMWSADFSGATFDSVIIGMSYTIDPTFAEHYRYKSVTTTSTVDRLTQVASGAISWDANDTQPSTITITAEKIPTHTMFSWDNHITKIDIYDGQSLVYTQTEKNKSFTHVFDNKTYIIKPTILIGYMIDTVTASSVNDIVVVNEDGTISWTAGWDNGDIFIYTKKDPSYYKKIPNGTYYWKDKLSPITESTYDEIIFNSNGRSFGGLTVTANTSWGLVEKISYGKNGNPMTVVAQRTSADQPLVWVDDKYKIITVDNVELTLPSYKWLYLRSNLRFSSEVEIVLYQNKAEANRVDKTSELVLVDTITGTMRDSISVTDMSIEIEYPIPTFNYVYIPLLNRYYFVDDITAVVYGVWDVALSVDVLMTYKTAIKALPAFIDRSESNYDRFVIDNKLPMKQGEVIETTFVTNELFVKESGNGTYVLQGLSVGVGDAVI